MTTNSAILDLAMGRLGRRQSTPIRAALVSEINASIDTLEKKSFLPWFLEATATYNFADFTIANLVGTADLPSGFIREAQDSRLYKIESDNEVTFFNKMLPNMIQNRASTSGVKSYHTFGSLVVKPAPVSTENFPYYLKYYLSDPGDFVDSSATSTNKWIINAKEVIVMHALRKIAMFHIMNDDLAAKFSAEFSFEYKELQKSHTAYNAENIDFYVGGASDGS